MKPDWLTYFIVAAVAEAVIVAYVAWKVFHP
jgi:hypothetical protein